MAMPVVHADGRLEDPESELELEVSRKSLALCTGLSTASTTASSENMCRCIGWLKGRTGCFAGGKGSQQLPTAPAASCSSFSCRGIGLRWVTTYCAPSHQPRAGLCCNWTDRFHQAADQLATWWGTEKPARSRCCCCRWGLGKLAHGNCNCADVQSG